MALEILGQSLGKYMIIKYLEGHLWAFPERSCLVRKSQHHPTAFRMGVTWRLVPNLLQSKFRNCSKVPAVQARRVIICTFASAVRDYPRPEARHSLGHLLEASINTSTLHVGFRSFVPTHNK